MTKIKRRRLKKRILKNKIKILIFIVIILIFTIGSGYALLNQTINISGKATIKSENYCKDVIINYNYINSWTVENNIIQYASSITIKNNTKTDIDGWSIKFKGPNDLVVLTNADVKKSDDNIITLSSNSSSKNYAWNSKIKSGETKTLSIQFSTTQKDFKPLDIVYNDCKSLKEETKENGELESLSINPAEYTMTVGETLTLNVIKNPENASSDIVWMSSDESVSVLDNGTITALKPGTSVITATSNNIKAEAKITVKNKVLSSDLNMEYSTLYSYKSQMHFKIKIKNLSEENITSFQFNLDLPDKTKYTIWSNPGVTTENNTFNLKLYSDFKNGNEIEITGLIELPEGYDSSNFKNVNISNVIIY